MAAGLAWVMRAERPALPHRDLGILRPGQVAALPSMESKEGRGSTGLDISVCCWATEEAQL